LIADCVPEAKSIVEEGWFLDILYKICAEETDKDKIFDRVIDALTDDGKVFPTRSQKDEIKKELGYASAIYYK
jgi:hypothetical protein